MKHIFLLIALAGVIASCNNMNNANSDKTAKMKQTVMQLYKAFDSHNLSIMDSVCTPDYKEGQIMDPKNPPTLAGAKADMQEMFAAFPDMKGKTNYWVIQGDTAAVGYTIWGTNTGPSMGGPATGKSFKADGVDFFRFVNGKIAEHWGYMEEMKMMMQLHPEMMVMKGDSTKKM